MQDNQTVPEDKFSNIINLLLANMVAASRSLRNRKARRRENKSSIIVKQRINLNFKEPKLPLELGKRLVIDKIEGKGRGIFLRDQMTSSPLELCSTTNL